MNCHTPTGGAETAVLATADGSWCMRVLLPEAVTHAEVLPCHCASVSWDGAVVEVKADAPAYVVLACNYQDPQKPHRTCYLMVDAPQPDVPAIDDPAIKVLLPGEHIPADFLPDQRRTVVLMPGVHTVCGELVTLAGDMRLHLCPGAFLRSYLRADGVHHLRITGTGVVDGTGLTLRGREWRDNGWDGFIFFRRCYDCEWDGPTILNSPFWNFVTFDTRGMRIRHCKALTWKVNNDGIQPRSCQDLLVEDCFLKCADDCIAIKTRRDAGMHSHDLTFRRLTLWNDFNGNPLEIGHNTQSQLLERVVFEDIDIVHARGGNLLSAAIIDGCEVRDVHYRNIRQEGFCDAGLLGFRIETSRYSTDVERGSLHDITIEGMHVTDAVVSGRICGYDAAHPIANIRLQDLRIAGTLVRALSDLDLVTEHVQDISLD